MYLLNTCLSLVTFEIFTVKPQQLQNAQNFLNLRGNVPQYPIGNDTTGAGHQLIHKRRLRRPNEIFTLRINYMYFLQRLGIYQG